MAYNDDKFNDTLPDASTSLATDTQFTGLYRAESAPIFGGMGQVLKVFHTSWNLSLALKRPQPQLFTTESQKTNFVNECEVWISLGLHPHIVSCYYVREIGGVPSIFAEWMDGGSLKELIDSGALYQGDADAVLERILDIAIQFARGLHFAHQQGLIHQDVKPANLLFSADGIAKVADFGIANALAGVSAMTGGNNMAGTIQTPAGAYTPAYCSPEQAEGRTLSRRTDIYSWAVSVLEMLLGERVWSYGNIVALALDEYLSMARKVAVPASLAELLKHCLKAEAAQRPADFADIETALRAIYQEVTGRPYPRPKARQSQDIASGLNNKALSLLDLNKPEEALHCWEQALLANPSHSESVYNRIVFLWHRGDLADEDALRLIRMDFENHMGDAQSSLLAGKICLELGDSYLANGFLERAATIPESRALLAKLPVTKGAYRCDYALSRVVDYMAYLELQQKFDELEAQIKDLYERKQIKEALHQLNAITYNPDLTEFAFAPQKLALNEALGRYGVIVLVNATWPVRRISAKLSRNLCFTPKGAEVFTGHTLYDVKTGDAVRSYECLNPEPAHRVFDMLGQDVLFSGFSFDGKYIMIADKTSHDIMLVEAASGQLVRHFAGHTGDITTLSFNADARYAVSGSADGTLRLWRVSDGVCLRLYEVKDGALQKVIISYDATRAAVMGANGIQVINLQTGTVLNKVHGQGKILDFCIDTAFTQMVMACGAEGIKSYNLQSNKTTEHRDAVQTKENRGNPTAQCVCFLPNDRWVAVGSGKLIYFWNIKANRIFNMIPCGGTVLRLVFNNDGRYLAAMTYNGTELWRCDYQYAFEKFEHFVEPAHVHFEIFLMRYPPLY